MSISFTVLLLTSRNLDINPLLLSLFGEVLLQPRTKISINIACGCVSEVPTVIILPGALLTDIRGHDDILSAQWTLCLFLTLHQHCTSYTEDVTA